ncbi:trk system potassium uptake protein TrkA [Lachnospiraceae bacterium NE2001]|jgi:trk system potassium uptake protein TrkA|nr:trk system potassium uptake protein TrkA [Lachnospiraceae bacterium NE2001]
MSKQIAVLGMGRFGKSIALSLSDMGADVMAVDANPAVLEKISDKVTFAIEADLKNAESIGSTGIENMDVVVVAMGSDLTASITSVMAAKEQGVPFVMAKAADERMGAILEKVGADRVIYPEEETGVRTARTLMSDSFMDYFDIDKNLCMLEMHPKADWLGKNLIELNLREKYHANVVAIKDESGMHSFVDPNRPLEESDELLVLLEKSALKKLQK